MKQKRITSSLIFSVFVFCTILFGCGSDTDANDKSSNFKKVFIVVLENESSSNALKEEYLNSGDNSLTKRGAYLSNFTAATHPSQPNYIAMVAGDTFDHKTNSDLNLSEKSIVDLLEAKGISWKAYAEGYPGNCSKVSSKGKYYRKHFPFISFNNIRNNPSRCSHLVNATEWDQDVAEDKLAQYSFYTPDIDNDGHNTSVGFASKWLKEKFDSWLSSSKFPDDMLFVVLFDEAADGDHTNKIYAVLYGKNVIPGKVSDIPYNFYSLLRTIEINMGLKDLGKKDATATAITDVWK